MQSTPASVFEPRRNTIAVYFTQSVHSTPELSGIAGSFIVATRPMLTMFAPEPNDQRSRHFETERNP